MKIKRKKRKIKFVFEHGLLQKNFYTKNAYLGRRKLDRLFPVSPPSFTIEVFRSRTSFLKALHRKRVPNWLIAYVPPKNASRIYVLGTKERLAVKQEVSYRQVLLHEMTHLYVNALNPNLPDWLKEGVSVYIAAQIFKPTTTSADWGKIANGDAPFKHVAWGFAAKHDGYNIAGLFVLFLVRRYGWTKFIAAISHSDPGRFSIESISRYFGEELNRLIDDFKKQFVK